MPQQVRAANQQRRQSPRLIPAASSLLQQAYVCIVVLLAYPFHAGLLVQAVYVTHMVTAAPGTSSCPHLCELLDCSTCLILQYCCTHHGRCLNACGYCSAAQPVVLLALSCGVQLGCVASGSPVAFDSRQPAIRTHIQP